MDTVKESGEEKKEGNTVGAKCLKGERETGLEKRKKDKENTRKHPGNLLLHQQKERTGNQETTVANNICIYNNNVTEKYNILTNTTCI